MASIITQLFPLFTGFSWEIIVFFVTGTILFIVGIIGANVWPQKTFSRIYFIGAVLHGTITIAGFIALFMLANGILFDIVYSDTIWAVGFIIVNVLINIWGIYVSWVPRIITYQVTINKEHNWHGKRIVMFADTHYGNIY